MVNQIKENINQPEILEKLFRENRKVFESDFNVIYPEIKNTELAKFWKTRIDYDIPERKDLNLYKTDVIVMILACLISGILIKIPAIFNLDLDNFFFYEKNAVLIAFLGLTIYSLLINRSFLKQKIIFSSLAFSILAIYVNLLPSVRESNSINLVYIHLPLLVWCIYGLVFIDLDFRDYSKRIEYIRHNGDLAVLGAIIAIAGMILSGVTIGLFSAIEIDISEFYMENFGIIGIVSAPIVTTFIIKNYPTFTNKIAPIIANIFSPIVLLTLVVYLITIPISGKDPYNDRDFLLIFNLMLLGVMAIIVFSISESSEDKKQKFNEMILLLLTVVTLLIDLVALSAIFYRLNEYGITPNRLAVLGSNILIFGNLILIMIDLFKVNFRKLNIVKVELTIARYIPVYIAWILIVVFTFPILFNMQ